jgi:hypothetical protein
MPEAREYGQENDFPVGSMVWRLPKRLVGTNLDTDSTIERRCRKFEVSDV